jgi:NAD(P)H-hydrate repair Nnr-like enzyme with NAD(P)H-hydrate epimerase domain
MSGFQKFIVAILSIAVAGVFGFIAWIALGFEVPDGLSITAIGISGSGSNDTPDIVTDDVYAQDLTIWAVGDSLMVGSTAVLEDRATDIVVDAVVGRRIDEGIDVIADMFETGTPDVLVVALGTNNGMDDDHVDEIMELADGVNEVIFVNVSVPRGWESDTNETLERSVAAYDNASLVDWKSVSGSIDGLFRSDGYHLSPAGTDIWVNLILAEATR